MNISLNASSAYGMYAGTGMNSAAAGAVSRNAKIGSTCQDMESLLIQNMFKAMRASIPKSGLTGGGKAEEMFTEMLDAELSKTISAAGGIGLSSMMQRQLETVPAIQPEDSM